MFDFKSIPFYDNHTHEMNMDKISYTRRELTINYLHGLRDVLPEDGNGPLTVSEELAKTVENLGINKVMIHYLSQWLGCTPELEVVNNARNQELARMGCLTYARSLYKDQNIIGCTVDLDWSLDDKRLEQFPGVIQRLFRMDPLFDRLMASCETYSALRDEYNKEICSAIHSGFTGIKCHVGERFSFAVKLVTEKDAETCFAAAVSGDKKALANVYFAVLAETMLRCQELDVPIHIHTGSTGGPENLHDCDPRLMTDFLSNRQFLNTKIVFLHANHPNIGEAALMTHTFPHVWLDLSWTLPWIALDSPRILRTVLALAPHNKIMFGTGQHGIPEMVWIASKVAKRSLEIVMEEYVAEGFLSEKQARETAEQILYKNAMNLYRIPLNQKQR